jgi:hypothetical protein
VFNYNHGILTSSFERASDAQMFFLQTFTVRPTMIQSWLCSV